MTAAALHKSMVRALPPVQYVKRFGPTRRVDFLVLLTLAEKADDGRPGRAWGESALRSVPSIARTIRYSERSVQYALRRLVADGYLELTENRGVRSRTNIYRIVRHVRAVDGGAPATASVAPKGANTAPDPVTYLELTPPSPPSRAGKDNTDGADAPAHAPPDAARPDVPSSATGPPSPAHVVAKPRRRDAGAGGASGPAPPSPGALLPGLYGTESSSRSVARSLRCPVCAAPPGCPCTGKAGRPRTAHHAERRPMSLALIFGGPAVDDPARPWCGNCDDPSFRYVEVRPGAWDKCTACHQAYAGPAPF